MIRRLLIFGLLGPPVGLMTAMWGLIPLLNWATGGESIFDWRQLVLLPMGYGLGLIPALLAALVDEALATRGVSWRPVWTALAAFVASFVPLLTAIVMGFLGSPWLLVWGLIGAVPGFVCSLLCPTKSTGRAGSK